jgi:translation initiation factor 1
LCVADPFSEEEKGAGGTDGYVHIRIQQRNGRKTLTTVQGINSEFDLKKIVKVAKKVCIYFLL